MLKKLLKHEFKAMGRTLLPLFGAAILLSVFSAVFGRLFLNSDAITDFNILKILSTLLVIAFFVFIFAAVILSFTASIMRFKNNILGHEGYLTNVLPATTVQHIASKLITACVYQILASVTAVVSVIIFACIASGGFKIDWSEQLHALGKLFSLYGGRIAAYFTEGTVLSLASLVGLNLMLYASLAAGHSFNSKKVLKSVLAFVVFYFVSQIINAGLLNIASLTFLANAFQNASFQNMHIMMISLIILQCFYAAVYFIITNHFIGSKLNLE